MAHLLPKTPDHEEVAFVFTRFTYSIHKLELEYKDWYPVLSKDFVVQSLWYLELKDKIRAKIIKQAHDLKMSVVEFHSHPNLTKACFSWSDLEGLDEFVPHIMWRLKGRPYAAIVVTPSEFDALVWLNDSRNPQMLSQMRVGNRVLRPTGLTLK